MSQLEDDIARRARERLQLWGKDTLELYEMAGLEDNAVENVMATLLWFFASSLVQLKVSPKHAGKTVTQAMTEIYASDRPRRER